MRNTSSISRTHMHTYIHAELNHRHVRQSVCIATRGAKDRLSHSIKTRADRDARSVSSRTWIGEPVSRGSHRSLSTRRSLMPPGVITC